MTLFPYSRPLFPGLAADQETDLVRPAACGALVLASSPSRAVSEMSS